MPTPKAPRWILRLVATLAAIAAIIASLGKIQDFACREGLTKVCPTQFTLSLSSWPADMAGGWQAVITNPTSYTAQIVDANLIFERQNTPNVMVTVTPGPAEWRPPNACTSSDPPIPIVDLKPTASTSLRLMLYAGALRTPNQQFMAGMDGRIPERLHIACDLVVNVRAGDGRLHPLHSKFDCSRLPYPDCR